MSEEPKPPIRYGAFDANGVPQGFWPDDVFPPKENGSRNDKIPATAVVVTEEQYWQLLENQPNSRFIDGAVVIDEPLDSHLSSWGPTTLDTLGGTY